MSNFAPKRTEYGTGDRRWARNFLALDTHDVTLLGSAFSGYTSGIVPSGTAIELNNDGLGVPWTNGDAIGLLVNDFKVASGKNLVAVASGGGPVDRRYLPSTHAAGVESDLTAINFIN